MELHAADAISVFEIHTAKTDSTHLFRDFGRTSAKVNHLGSLFIPQKTFIFHQGRSERSRTHTRFEKLGYLISK